MPLADDIDLPSSQETSVVCVHAAVASTVLRWHFMGQAMPGKHLITPRTQPAEQGFLLKVTLVNDVLTNLEKPEASAGHSAYLLGDLALGSSLLPHIVVHWAYHPPCVAPSLCPTRQIPEHLAGCV